MLLSVEDVRLFYGPVEAVHGVTFQAGDGVTAIIGNNGAGKSTILKAISGLMRVNSGRITFNAADITGKNPADILKLGIAQTPEGRMVFPQSTVYENLVGGAYIRRDKAGINEDLEKYYEIFSILKKRLKMKAGLLSGGEQQMLAIARSLMSRPKLLMLDEPSLGLAPVVVEDVYRIIADIKKAGTSILLVEQNANKALSVADKAYVLVTGNIALEGTGAALANDPAVRNAYLGV